VKKSINAGVILNLFLVRRYMDLNKEEIIIMNEKTIKA